MVSPRLRGTGTDTRTRRIQEEDRRRRFRVPWPRRVGAIAALTLLGASLVMAAGGTFGGRPTGSGDPNASPRTGAGSPSPSRTPKLGPVSPSPTVPSGPVGPVLSQPTNPFTRARTIDVGGVLPDGLKQRAKQRLRIYVDAKLARTVKLSNGTTFIVKGIALRLGRHRITATVRGPGGETRPSEPITVTVDRTPPTMRLARPVEGELINADRATIEGAIRGGDRVSIRNETTGGTAAATPADNGSFSAEVPLGEGVNAFLIVGMDAAGNATELHVRVVRGEARPSAELRLSSDRIRISRLPVSLTIEAIVRDEDRRPIPLAQVTFTLSPPGLPTTTYHAETDSQGSARWERVSLPSDGATPGKGFATVFVQLPDGGDPIQETKPFTFE
jgi:hypothetical protein